MFDATDLHCKILSFLRMQSLVRCELVNKLWNKHALNPNSASDLSFGEFTCYSYDRNARLITKFYFHDISRFCKCTKVRYSINTEHLDGWASTDDPYDPYDDWDDYDDDDEDSSDDTDNKDSKANDAKTSKIKAPKQTKKDKLKIREENRQKMLKLCNQFTTFTKIRNLTIDIEHTNSMDYSEYLTGLLNSVKNHGCDTIESLNISNYGSSLHEGISDDAKKAGLVVEEFLTKIKYERLKSIHLSKWKLSQSFIINCSEFKSLTLRDMGLSLQFWNDLALKAKNYNDSRSIVGNSDTVNNIYNSNISKDDYKVGIKSNENDKNETNDNNDDKLDSGYVNLYNLSRLEMEEISKLPTRNYISGNTLQQVCCQLGNVEQLILDTMDYRFIEMFLYYLCEMNRNNNNNNGKHGLKLQQLSLTWRIFPEADESINWERRDMIFGEKAFNDWSSISQQSLQQLRNQFTSYVEMYNYWLSNCATDLKTLSFTLLKPTNTLLDLICKIVNKLLLISNDSNPKNVDKPKPQPQPKANGLNSNLNVTFDGHSNIETLKISIDTGINLDNLDSFFKKLQSIRFDKLKYFSWEFLLPSFKTLSEMLHVMQIMDRFINNIGVYRENIAVSFALKVATKLEKRKQNSKNETNDIDINVTGLTKEEELDVVKMCEVLKTWYVEKMINFDARIEIKDENKEKYFQELINRQLIENDQFKKEIEKKEKDIAEATANGKKINHNRAVEPNSTVKMEESKRSRRPWRVIRLRINNEQL